LKVLFIVAHPDDEALGLGGTIARHVQNGDEVYGISMTNGVGARGDNLTAIHNRIENSKKASEILGFKWINQYEFPDNAMDTVPLIEITKKIEEVKKTILPNIIYTHSSADLNIDHRIVSQATLTAFRPQPNELWQEIRTFEVPSATDFGHKSITGSFNPNLYIDISKTIQLKINALNIYFEEMRKFPHSRSFEGVKNLSLYRGSQVGILNSEAFEIIRRIER